MIEPGNDKADHAPAEDLPRCIAYTAGGRICGRPAVSLDVQRGGMVCRLHRPGRGGRRSYSALCRAVHGRVRGRRPGGKGAR